jgi:NAD(P)-dependent dehydrogenase (short-subunit alcohol dehydrogenase family)
MTAASGDSDQRRVAVVTGGAGGIGAALSEELARHGTRVIVCDSSAKRAGEVAERITRQGGVAVALPLDVRDREQIDALVHEVTQKFGRLDDWFNNAGLGCWGDAREFSDDAWREILDVNFWGCVHGSLAAYRYMAAHGGGRIVNVASLAGLVPVPGTAPYTASKHAVVGFSLALREEAAGNGVQVNVACPGPVKSGFHGSMLRPTGLAPGRKAPAELLDAGAAARDILRGVANNAPTIVFPGRARRTWWKWRLWPAWLKSAQRRIVENLRADAP